MKRGGEWGKGRVGGEGGNGNAKQNYITHKDVCRSYVTLETTMIRSQPNYCADIFRHLMLIALAYEII